MLLIRGWRSLLKVLGVYTAGDPPPAVGQVGSGAAAGLHLTAAHPAGVAATVGASHGPDNA